MYRPVPRPVMLAFPTSQACEAGDIAARSRQGSDQSATDRVSRHREDDRDDRGRLLCRNRWLGSVCENDIDLEADKLGRDWRNECLPFRYSHNAAAISRTRIASITTGTM
jgi:hypothetical protein